MADPQKHTVHTDALLTLGTAGLDDSAARDAIHLAVEPMLAGETLYPGQRIDIRGKYAFAARGEGVGIVDPFLPTDEGIHKGQRFWLVVLPRAITSLRHVWSHPAFPEIGPDPVVDGAKNAKSTLWVTNFAQSCDMDYDKLMDGADAYLAHGDYITGGSELEGQNVPDEFWLHYCILRGKEVPRDKQDSFFSCAC